MGVNKTYSKEYRKQTKKTAVAIFFFLLIYLIVILFSFLLISLLLVESSLMLNARNILVNILGLVFGLISLMILSFLIVFFFRKSATDRSDWIEVNAQEQPKLFELIKTVADQIHTRLPDKVYFSPGVDAAVFYESNFWNLLLPRKENLMIGFGLLNCINVGELKAILAHEFGHLSQRRLSLNSFVYVENQIIYKMLIDEFYHRSLIQKFKTHFGPFCIVIIIYASIIRSILRQAYQLVYKTYMAMSREAEFHADEIAAKVAGWKQLTSSLRRLELGTDSFGSVMEFYFSHISENIKTENIYPNHYCSLKIYADKFNLEIENGLPKVKKGLLYRFIRSKLIINEQWASHPSIKDRIEHVRGINNEPDSPKEISWKLISNNKELQAQLTSNIFKHWKYSKEPKNLSELEFEEKYRASAYKYSFNKIYNYFYDFRDITKLDVEALVKEDTESIYNDFNEIYSDANVEKVHVFNGLDNDLKLIESMVKREIKVSSFEYDGLKYKFKQAQELKKIMMEKHKAIFDEVNEMDKNIFKYFYNIAKTKEQEEILLTKYRNYFAIVEEDKKNLQVYLDLINSMQFIWKMISIQSIEESMEEFKQKEAIFREKLKNLVTDELMKSLIEPEKISIIETYLSKDWKYFENNQYDDAALAKLEECIYLFYYYYSRAPIHLQKDILDFQLALLNNPV